MDWLYSLVNTNQNIENIYKMKMINPYVNYNLLKSFFSFNICNVHKSNR